MAAHPPGSILFRKWDIPRGSRLALWRTVRPAQLFVASFAVLIAFGAVGLKVLPGLYTGPALSWKDALFTSTSASCVTGLIVVDTATYFTFAGQLFILLLIQLGGLGMIAFTSLIIVALGRRLSLRHEAMTSAASLYDVAPHISRHYLMRDVVRFTLAIEAAGAVLLYLLWAPQLPNGWRTAAWPAVFHSVSAFCNAGFSTFSDSLIGMQRSPLSLSVVMGLIVAGGIGFLTLEELLLRVKARRREQIFRVSIHTRLVIAVTLLLLIGGWVFYAIFEWNRSLAGMPWPHRLVNALFFSVTARTAGFNTVDYTSISDGSQFLTVLLMAIGGSPGSTAGGVKTTTVALIALLAWSRLRGREVVSFWGRSIPNETIERAVGLFVVCFGVVTAGIFLLAAFEPRMERGGLFLEHMFEAVSAFNTVGLSAGVTSGLSDFGKFVVIALMFVGRVGPLTFAAALATRHSTRASQFRYAYEDVVIG